MIVTTLAFRHYIKEQVIQWALKTKSEAHFGQSLHYDRFTLTDKRLTLDKVTLVDTSHNHEGGYLLTASSIDIDYHLDIWSRRLDMSVVVHEPKCTISRKISGPLPPFPFDPEHPRLLHVQAQLELRDGQVELSSHIPGEQTLQRLFFSFKGTADKLIGGTLITTFDPFTQREENCIHIALEGNEQGGSADIAVHSMDCRDMARVTQFFLGEGIQAWTVPEGSAQGRLVAAYGANHQLRLDGQLKLQDLQFAHSALAIKGEVEEAKLQLFDLQSPELDANKSVPLGRLELVSGGQLTFFKEGQAHWEIQHLSGGLYLDAKDASRIELNGICLHEGEPSRLNIEGQTLLLGVEHPFANLNVLLHSPHKEDVRLHFRAEQTGAWERTLELHCQNMSRAEVDILQNLLPDSHTTVPYFTFIDGRLDASIKAHIYNNTVQKVDIRGVKGDHLALSFPLWGLSMSCDTLEGHLLGDLSAENFLTSLDTQLFLGNGTVGFLTPKGKFWEFSDIDAELAMKDGLIDKSMATASFAGLQGEITLDWLSPDKILHFDFKGAVSKFLPFVPSNWRDKFHRGFAADHLHVSADVKRKGAALELDGLLKVQGSDEIEDRIHFGFDLKKVSQGLWAGWNDGSPEKAAIHKACLHNIQALLPSGVSPCSPFLTRWLEDEFGIYGFVIRDGWFYAKNLPVHKYFEPFAFEDERKSLTGFATVKGEFLNQNLRIRYHAEDLTFETPHFKMEVPRLGDSQGLEREQQATAVHYFDPSHGKHFGFLSISGATYTDKNYNLVFEQVETEVIIEERKIHYTDIQATAEGVYFAGRVDVDLLSPDEEGSTIQLRSTEISGTVSQARRLLGHFDTLFLDEWPVTGHFLSPNQGAYLKLSVRPEGNTVDFYMLGQVSDCRFKLGQDSIEVDTLSTQFDYNLQSNTLVLSDIDGIVKVGPSTDQDHYRLSSKEIHIANFPQHHFDFDVRVESAIRDVIRIEGSARTLEDPQHGTVVAFNLNPDHSYFGEIRPNITSLVVRDWSELVSFAAEPALELSTAVGDLTRLSKAGWMSSYREGMQSLQQLDIAGSIQAKIHLDPSSGHYHFTAHCDNLSSDDQHFNNCFLSGKKAGDKWSIDQLQIDEMSLAADLISQEDGWKLDFLGLSYADTALLGLEGKYLAKEQTLSSRLKLFEIDLERAQKLPIPEDWLAALDLKGRLRASGQLTLQVENDADPIHITADLQASYRDLKVAGIEFHNQEGIPFAYDSHQGVQVGRMQVTVKNNPGKPSDIDLWIDGVRIIPSDREMHVSNLSFAIPSQQLLWLSHTLEPALPVEVSSTVSETIAHLKDEGALTGNLDLRLSPTDYEMTIRLDEDDYRFLDKTHSLRNFSLVYTPYELRFDSEYLFKDNYHWMTGRTSGPSLEAGRLFIGVNEHTLANYDESSTPLTIYWNQDPYLGLQIQRVDGHYQGLTFNLNQSEDNADSSKIQLFGQVGIDGQVAKELFDVRIREAIERWEIGDGFELSGNFLIDKTPGASPIFDGILVGRDFKLKGYQLNTLFAQLHYSDGSLSIEDFKILDAAGQLRISQLEAWRYNDQWQFYTPLLLVQDFRPSLLNKLNTRPKKQKPLTITQLELKELKGRPGDSTSIQGGGQLNFVNPKKKNIRNTLLVIPQDILSRIGLDPDVMTPVGGTITYTIEDGRVYLNEMKDVYSEGRLSKFYIPNGRYRSSMDFDGNLNLQVRMKQYNLIFKITELLTITVRGTLVSPNYTLKKQNAPQSTDAQQNESVLLEEQDASYTDQG